MRPQAGWGTVAELMEPKFQAAAFFGGPSGPNYPSPRGLLDIPSWQSMGLGEAAQVVEVSAFPDRYNNYAPVAEQILATLTTGTVSTAELGQAAAAAERDRLDDERMKLLQAHYSGAVPIDLLKQEQDRIADQIGDIQHRIEAHHDEYASARANLDDSLGLLANIVSIYQRADDANRRLCNQAFFHRIFIQEDGDVRVEYERPFGSLCDTEEQMNALNWATEAKKKGEAQTGLRVVTLVEGLNLSHLGSLRRQFSNPKPKLESWIYRWKRGVYRVSQRAESTPIQDVRGPWVRRVGKPQTFLTTAEVDRLVDDYLAGLSVGYLAQKYGVHRATVSKHLTRNNVVRRQHGLTIEEAAEAVKLHRGGISMRAIARTLGVDRKQVRVSLVTTGAL